MRVWTSFFRFSISVYIAQCRIYVCLMCTVLIATPKHVSCTVPHDANDNRVSHQIGTHVNIKYQRSAKCGNFICAASARANRIYSTIPSRRASAVRKVRLEIIIAMHSIHTTIRNSAQHKRPIDRVACVACVVIQQYSCIVKPPHSNVLSNARNINRATDPL